MKLRYWFIIGSLLGWWLVGCNVTENGTNEPIAAATDVTLVLPEATLSLTPTLVPPSLTPIPPTLTATATATSTPTPTATPTATPTPIRFAAIGDYGKEGEGAAAVATLVHSWQVDFIVTLGDNNYPDGAAATIDDNIGQYYADYIYPYTGEYSSTATINRFFPALGNHDWRRRGAKPYLDYFTLPGNERYYDFVWGPVHVFVLNSDFNEPDGFREDSVQAQWLEREMGKSAAAWQIVTMHVSPYSSGHHGSHTYMRWPFAAWGADAVLSGHDHHYERLTVDGIPYFVNGLGGNGRYSLDEPLNKTEIQYNAELGAMLITATEDVLTFAFITHTNEQIDQHTITAE